MHKVRKLNYLIPVVISFLFINTAQSQNFGIYVSPGLMNYGGDLQAKAYTFSQAGFSISGGLLYNINHFTVRGAFTYGKVQGSDSASSNYAIRNLSFISNISEGSLTLEYDIFKLSDKKFTPYALAGVAVYHYNPYTTYNGQKVYLKPLSTEGQGLPEYPDRKEDALTQFAIPWGVGFKYKLTEQFHIGLEFCGRVLFNDQLDDVSGYYPDEATLLKERGQLAVDVSFRGDELNPTQTYPSDKLRGSPKHNDNYYTSSLMLIYMFPHNDMFGNSGGRRRHSRSMDCPKL